MKCINKQISIAMLSSTLCCLSMGSLVFVTSCDAFKEGPNSLTESLINTLGGNFPRLLCALHCSKMLCLLFKSALCSWSVHCCTSMDSLGYMFLQEGSCSGCLSLGMEYILFLHSIVGWFYDIRMAQTVSAVTPSCISRVCSRSHEHHKPF
jgi:hypothetical protein